MHTNEFHLARITNDFQSTAHRIMNCLSREAGHDWDSSIQVIRDQVEALERSRLLRIAFIGQYNAGKSTILSALTGDRSIKRDSDIATDVVTNYPWHGILLTDTPGLFTERHDHDALTYEAIRQSDLLVFVITSDLFDTITVGNFIKLAYEEGYRNKMLLVVNKMSMETGTFDDLVQYYTESLDQALTPYTSRDFRVFFCDAADYLEGVEEHDTDLVEFSHFASFMEGLNDFVQHKGILGKLDTPIRVVLSEVDRVLIGAISNKDDDIFFKLLDRIERRVRTCQSQAEDMVNLVVSHLKSEIILHGNTVCSCIGGGKSAAYDDEVKKVEMFLQQETEATRKDLERQLEGIQADLADALRELQEGEMGQYYWKRTSSSGVRTAGATSNEHSSFHRNAQFLQYITSRASGTIIEKAGGGAVTGFMRSGQVAGTELHGIVYSVGKFFGVKFQPWGAVNVAKGITNVAKVVGPVLSLVGVVLSAKEMWNDDQKRKDLVAARNQCSAEFVAIAEDIERQFQDQFKEYQRTIYQDVFNRIVARRKETIVAQQRKDRFSIELRERRDHLEWLLNELYQPYASRSLPAIIPPRER